MFPLKFSPNRWSARFKGVKIAWSLDLGELPVEPDVRSAIEGKRQVFSDLGATLVETAPDLTRERIACSAI